MTIKSIKEKYTGKYGDHDERTMFKVHNFTDPEIGKAVVIVTYVPWYGRTVWQAVRVSDGKELIEKGSCRPCDNMDDAIDVICEMISDGYGTI